MKSILEMRKILIVHDEPDICHNRSEFRPHFLHLLYRYLLS